MGNIAQVVTSLLGTLPDEPQSLTALAKRWGCSSETLAVRIRRGKLAAFRVGARGDYRVAVATIIDEERRMGCIR